MNHRFWRTAILIVLALVAVGCSGSSESSANLVPIDEPAPGVLYVSSVAGDIHQVIPAGADASVVVSARDTGQPVVDLAMATSPVRLQALVRQSGQSANVIAADVDVVGSGFEAIAIETESTSLTCLDPHTAATTPVAHETEAAGADGARFTVIALAGGSVDADFELLGVTCPRWSADRQTVATARPTRNNDPSSYVTVVQTADGEQYEIGFDQCGTTPTSFSPDDRFIALALTCYSASWNSSGLYLLSLDGLADAGDLTALSQLGSGLFGRTAWHPQGDWIAAVRADPIERQNIAMDLSAQPVGLQVIELATTQTLDLELADGATPFSIAWFETALSN